jgi:hypothetical protein
VCTEEKERKRNMFVSRRRREKRKKRHIAHREPGAQGEV